MTWCPEKMRSSDSGISWFEKSGSRRDQGRGGERKDMEFIDVVKLNGFKGSL